MTFGPKRRVAVAKDVLKQLRSKKYIAQTGTYLELEDTIVYDENSNSIDLFDEAMREEKDLQEILPKVTCIVCAKGAILASKVNLFNKFQLNYDVDFDQRAGETTEEVFGMRQATLIEAAFEGWSTFDADINEEEGLKCRALKERYPEPLNRMRVIMNNIVRNKGVFRP